MDVEWKSGLRLLKYNARFSCLELIHIMYKGEASDKFEKNIRKKVGLFIFRGVIFHYHFCTC